MEKTTRTTSETVVTITKDELIGAGAIALTNMVLKKPALMLLHNELSEAIAMTVKVLFDEKEEDK